MPYKDKDKQKEYSRKWEEENKEKRREDKRKWREDNKEYYKEYRELNKEKRAECDRRYREENKEKKEEYYKKWYQLNKEKRAEYQKKYREENKEKIREERREHHNERRGHCIEYLGGKCVECGTTHNLQFDHIKREGKKYEITRKLTYKFDNLKEELDKCQLLCAPCHLQKTAKEWADITHKTVPLSKLNTMP